MAITTTGSGGNYLKRAVAITPSGNFTFACWVYFPGSVPSTGCVFIALNDVNGYNLSLLISSLFEAAANVAGNNLIASSFTPVANTWYHVCGTFDSGGTPGNYNTVTLYVNGAQVNQATSPHIVGWTPTAPLSTSLGGDGGHSLGGGNMAYPGIWNTLLTTGQIAALAQPGTAPSSIASANLLSFAPLQSGSLSTDTVSSSYTTTGTVTNVGDPFSYGSVWIQKQGTFGGSPTNTSPTFALAYPANVTAGNLLAAAVSAAASGLSLSVTDSQGNTWTKVGTDLSDTTDGVTSNIFYAKAGSSAADTITFHFGSNQWATIFLYEFSGNDPTSLFDKAASQVQTGIASGGNATTPSITPARNNALLLALFAPGTGIDRGAENAIAQLDSAGSGFAAQWATQITAGSINSVAVVATGSTTACGEVIAAFYSPTAGGSVAFAGTAHPKISSSAALQTTRPFAGSAQAKIVGSGALSGNRFFAGTAAPKISASGTLGQARSFAGTTGYPFLITQPVPLGSVLPTSYTINGLPGSPITTGVQTNGDGSVQLHYSLAGIPRGTYTVNVIANTGSVSSPTSPNFVVTIGPMGIIASGTLGAPVRFAGSAQPRLNASATLTLSRLLAGTAQPRISAVGTFHSGLHFPMAIADASSVLIGSHVTRHFPIGITDQSSVVVGFHIVGMLHLPLVIIDTSTVLALGFERASPPTTHFLVQIVDASLGLGFEIGVGRAFLQITDASSVRCSYTISTAFAPPPLIVPPYTGQSQPADINVPARIAYAEATREEGPWVMPPYANLYPQPAPETVDVVPPPIRTSDLWSAMQTWPL